MLEEVDCLANAETKGVPLVVVFASQDGGIVDQHFGSSVAFYAYEVALEKARLIASQQFLYESQDGNEDKLKPKLAWLYGGDIVYCASVGDSAARQLAELGITPIKVMAGAEIDKLIKHIQIQLAEKAEFWLSNIINRKQRASQGESRFKQYAEDGWNE
ncbi:NifB/NifX family molybdenum-iron cluster-binding protein [Teredinibacter haidensis]|uniref:NifB/NifX family molybdenum-iron cluster-binding protein n=1 Tax=Teredinibacter haidensis TaxID=2731755 RepID=UPI000948D89F|nr:NifB/NifX family molybdenum-iron cluster-binding protein [Teredinibacter haidensis]